MKGLIMKDLCLLKPQRKTALTVIGISIFLLIMGTDISFVIIYASIVSMILSINTITYDMEGNTMTYLLSLPSSRHDYITEKYLFGSFFTIVMWLALILLVSLVQTLKHTGINIASIFRENIPIVVTLLIMLFIYIPLQIKFGVEKSRIVSLITGGIIIVGTMLFAKLKQDFGIDKEEMIEFFSRINSKYAIILGVLSLLLLFFISYQISLKIIDKKEF